MSESRKELREKIEKWFEQKKDDMINDLGEIIAVKSVESEKKEGAPYGAGSREVLSLAASMMEKHGFDVTTFEDMIITAQMGPEPLKMGILAHLDVVAGGDGWDTDPFEMVIKDGKIFGRGTTDNKGPSVASMYAMYCARDLCPDLKHGFQIILGSGEETGCNDIANYLSKNTTPPHVFTPDVEYPIVNAEKGRFAPTFCASWDKDITLPRIVSLSGGSTMNVIPNRAEAVTEGLSLDEVKSFCADFSEKTGVTMSAVQDGDYIKISALGAAAHAARPEHGNNAQTAIIEMLASMPFAESKSFGHVKALNRLFPHGDYYGRAFGIAMSDDKLGELTLSFCVVNLDEHGVLGNFDSRTPVCADDVDLVGMTYAAFEREGFTVTDHYINKSHYTSEDSPFVRTLLSIYEDYTGNPRECKSTGGQTYAHGIPGGVVFGTVLPGVENNVHGPNEFIGVENLVTSAKMFAQAILEICGE